MAEDGMGATGFPVACGARPTVDKARVTNEVFDAADVRSFVSTLSEGDFAESADGFGPDCRCSDAPLCAVLTVFFVFVGLLSADLSDAFPVLFPADVPAPDLADGRDELDADELEE
jgi:hypothetical protein